MDVIEVTGPDGDVHRLRVGERVVFGRGPDVDIVVGKDPWLSRHLGSILIRHDGVQVTNLSKKFVLYARTRVGEFPLPAVLPGEGGAALLLPPGSAVLGSASSLEQRRGVIVTTPEDWPAKTEPGPTAGVGPGSTSRNLSTERRLSLNPETKGFMVALLLCRPWLRDSQRIASLPTVPELVEEVLTVTNAHHLLAQVRGDRKRRDAFAEVIKGHIRELREKLRAHGLIHSDSPVGHSVVVSTLIHYDIIAIRDLELFEDPLWLTVQENKWWNA